MFELKEALKENESITKEKKNKREKKVNLGENQKSETKNRN